MDHSQMIELKTHEIPPILERALLFGGILTQPTVTSSLGSPIRHIGINSEGKIVIKLDKALDIADNRHISIKFNYRNFLFHLNPEEYSRNGLTFVVDFPKKGRALVSRTNERYVLPLNSEILTTFHRIEKRNPICDIEAHLYDVSQNGLGIIIPNAEEGMLANYDHLWIKSLNHTDLIRPIFGRIVYVNSRKYKDQKLDMKAGISLDGHLPDEIFKELQKLCQLVLKA